jgi:hypothetical protein
VVQVTIAVVASVRHHICSDCCSQCWRRTRTLADVGEFPAQGVQVLALVQLPGDSPPVRLVGQIPGRVHGKTPAAAQESGPAGYG